MATVDLVVTEFILLAIICVALMRYYTGSMVQIDVIATVYLSWVLGLSGILLLPYDISVAIVDHAHSNILDNVWRFVYWSTFSLAWIILPIQMEYHNSGHFSFADKMKDAMRRNCIMACLAVVAGLAYMIYLLSTTGLSPSEVVGFMMALNNTYGVFLIILLMGSGLAALPRRLWQMGDNKQELRRLYISANGVEGAYQDARYSLEDCESEVQAVVEAVETRLGTGMGVDPICVSHVRTLQLKVENFQFSGRSNSKQHLRALQSETGAKSSSSGRSSHASGMMSSSSTAAAVSLEKPYLVDLHSRLIRAQIRAGSSERRWKLLAQHISSVENHATDRAASGEDWLEMKIEMSASSNTGGLFTSLVTRSLQLTRTYLCCCVAPRQFNTAVHSAYVLLSRWKHIIYRVLSVLAGLLSLIILWSELVLSTSLHSPIGMLIGAYSGSDSATTQSNSTTTNGISAYVQFVCFITLAYMSLCTYWSLFRLNLGWAYTLQGPQQSSPSSLIYNGEYFSRLQFPLGYNFLMTLNASILKSTSFSGIMSNIQLVPLFGTSFTVFVPMLMILFAIFTSLNLLPRMLSWIGVETEDPVGGPMFPCLDWFSPTPPLSGDDLLKYESGRLIVINELKQASLLKMIASGGNATGSVGGGINMSRGGLTAPLSSSRSSHIDNPHTPYTRTDSSSYSRGSLSVSSNSYLLDDDEPNRIDDDFNDYERGGTSSGTTLQVGRGLHEQNVSTSRGKFGDRISGPEALLDSSSSQSSSTFFGFNFSSYFKVSVTEDNNEEVAVKRTSTSSDSQSIYSSVPAAGNSRPAQVNHGFSNGRSNNAFALSNAMNQDDDEDLGGRYS